ncbi:CRISPR-associated ring nuclease Csm6 [Vibrio chaetopteri]|uniref:CRISPR-associated ring nuclease Csm6 n=1 Tax=Vibrio chaetopteri TaxID=3016528 RepID=UPI003AB54D8D
MKKHILLSIAGLTPQVITETLFGIHQEQQKQVTNGITKWHWPERIEVITTSLGKEQIMLGLLAKDGEGLSMLEKLCRDYQRPVPELSDTTIMVIPDEHGQPVKDARSKQDHEALASFIVRHVARLCSEPEVQLHASLAGGRKTMTFFLGYALALFAREGDTLSHVLVDKDYEGIRDFYYPTPNTHPIPGREENSHIDASKAKVTLAEIPYIRHRNIHTKGSLACLENQSYRDLTDYQNAMQHPESIHLQFHLIQKRVYLLGKTIDFRYKPLELAFYAMIAANQLDTNRQPLVMQKQAEPSLWLADRFLNQLEHMAGVPANDYSEPLLRGDKSAFMRSFRERATLLTDSDVLLRGAGEQAIARTYLDLNVGMSFEFFNDKKNSLKAFLLEHFPADIVDYILPAQVYVKGQWPKRRAFSRTGQQNSPIGLWLEDKQITFR